MHHQIEQAILPHLPLEKAMKEWNSIHSMLAEAKRKRKNQIPKAFNKTS
jgi:hypothetical protein